jgi:hypothetical protein
MFSLQPRDKELFSKLSKYGVMSTECIAAILFRGVAHTTVMRRLRKLEELEQLLRLTGLPNSMNAWCLTRAGAEVISAREPFRYSNKNVLLHEVRLTDVRIALESVGIGENWTSEMEMRRERGWQPNGESQDALIPDGVFITEADGHPAVVAVELELTPKNHARYDKLFRHYARRDALSQIWYIVANISIGNLVRDRWNEIQRYRPAPVLIVSLLDEVLQDTRTARVWTQSTDTAKKLQDHFECTLVHGETSNDVRPNAHQVSSSEPQELSSLESGNPKSDQSDPSAPDFKMGSARSPRPLPLNMSFERGVEAYRHKEKSGADGKEVDDE